MITRILKTCDNKFHIIGKIEANKELARPICDSTKVLPIWVVDKNIVFDRDNNSASKVCKKCLDMLRKGEKMLTEKPEGFYYTSVGENHADIYDKNDKKFLEVVSIGKSFSQYEKDRIVELIDVLNGTITIKDTKYL